MMEPERPKVDRAVLTFLRTEALHPADFTIPRGWGGAAQSGVGQTSYRGGASHFQRDERPCTDHWIRGGAYFGSRERDDLGAYFGHHVGRFEGDEVFGPDGRYLGELMSDKLITRLSSKSSVSSFMCLTHHLLGAFLTSVELLPFYTWDTRTFQGRRRSDEDRIRYLSEAVAQTLCST